MPSFSSKLPRRLRSVQGRQVVAGYLFVTPSLGVLSLFVIWPIVQAVWMSINNVDFLNQTSSFAGASNYQQLAGDSRFWNALRNTALYSAGVVPISVVLGACLTNKRGECERHRGAGVGRTACRDGADGSPNDGATSGGAGDRGQGSGYTTYGGYRGP